jgi:protein-S-isoprenylcysteine O-methyltransferase Ste14
MTEDTPQSGATVRFPPPVVHLIALAAGFGLNWGLGSLPNPLAGAERFIAGGALIVVGLLPMALAQGLFQKTGQDSRPWKHSPVLIAEGIYRWTRNPMYLGMGLLQAGIGLVFANLWIVALVPVTWAAIYLIAIRPEEEYLETRFGTSYVDYKQQVRRWL